MGSSGSRAVGSIVDPGGSASGLARCWTPSGGVGNGAGADAAAAARPAGAGAATGSAAGAGAATGSAAGAGAATGSAGGAGAATGSAGGAGAATGSAGGAGAATGSAGGGGGNGNTGAAAAGGGGGGTGTAGWACAGGAPTSSAATAPRPAEATVNTFASMSILTDAPLSAYWPEIGLLGASVLTTEIVTPAPGVTKQPVTLGVPEHVLLRSICNRPQQAPSVV